MKREIMNDLLSWKRSPHRKPLILNGVRQVGKTWALKELGRTAYENCVYINFEEYPEFRQYFATTKEPQRIVQNLMIATGKKITPGDTLLIFDEIQACGEALNSLKYFQENAPEYHVACAGSLLGVLLAKARSFPVGKVDFLDVHPLTFSEFLEANGDGHFREAMASVDALEPLPDALHNPLSEKLKMYFVVGGMPEPVALWTQERDIEGADAALEAILRAYERDFMKHPERNMFDRIMTIWSSIPSQLARENKKFLYSAAKENARGREYEGALQWLVESGVALKVFRSERPYLPLSAYDDLSAFKIYLADAGLLRRKAALSTTAFHEGNRLFTEFKGALTENFVLQSLRAAFEVAPRYWSQAKPQYEIDFIIQRENDVFPVEVKSDLSVRSPSLHYFKTKFADAVKLRLRFSMQNLHLDEDLLNIPLYMIDQTDRLIGLALEKISAQRTTAAAKNEPAQKEPQAFPALKERNLYILSRKDASTLVTIDLATGERYTIDLSRTQWLGSGEPAAGTAIQGALLNTDGTKLYGTVSEIRELPECFQKALANEGEETSHRVAD